MGQCCLGTVDYSDIGWNDGDESKDSFVKVYFKDRRDAISLVSTVSDEAGSHASYPGSPPPKSLGATPMPYSMDMHEVQGKHLQISLESDAQTPVTLPESKNEISKENKKYEGNLIAGVLQKNFPRLVDAVDPKEAAKYLYGVGIIGESELESAMNEMLNRSDRASNLMRILIRKLRANPHWCHDAFVALKTAGLNMESVIQELDDCSKNQSMCLQSRKPLPALGEESEDDVETSMTEPKGGRCIWIEPQKQHQNGRLDQQEQLPNHPINLDSHEKSTDDHEVIITPKGQKSRQPRPHQDPGFEDTGAPPAQSDANASKQQDENGNTRLHLAVDNQDVEAVRMLVNSKCIINCRNNEDQTALHISTIKRFPVITVELLKSGECDPYLFDKNKKTPLHYACSSGMIDLVKPIVKHCSADCVNAPDGEGDSALHIATRNGYTEIVKLLRKNKAKRRQKNHKGETPIDIAQRSGNHELIASLQSRSEAMVDEVKTKFSLKRSASCSLARASSKTSVVSQSQSELNFKYM